MTQATQPRPRPLLLRDVPAIDKRELVNADDFAFAIARRWQDSVLAIIDVGKLLLGAKAALDHGGFIPMVDSNKVPFKRHTALQLMKVAEHAILVDVNHGQHLPPSWRTLYELTRAPDEAIRGWLTDGTIHPEMQRKDVLSLLRSLRTSTRASTSNHPFEGEKFRLIRGDALDEALKLPAKSVDAIVTDPPYGVEFLECYDKLAELADHLLRDGGNCLVMIGQANLPLVLETLVEHLEYCWTLCYFTPGASAQVFGRHVKSNWKPILWLTKGKNENEHISALITSDASDKRFHEWGQSVTGMSQVVDQDFRFGSSDGTSLHPHPAKRNHFSTRKRRRLRRNRSSPLLAPHGG